MKSFKILGLALALCLSGAVQADDVTQNLAVNVLQKTYQGLAAGARTMLAKAQELQAQPTQAKLEEAQQAWKDMRKYWEASEGFLFGPVSDLGIDPQIDTWPMDRAEVARKLNGGDPLGPEDIRPLTQEVQGFHVLEYILFGDGKNSNTINVGTLNARSFQYLVSASILLAEYTGQLENAWTTHADPNDPSLPGYSQILGNPGGDNPKYPSEVAVYNELVDGMLAIIDEVATGKIATPFGGDIGSVELEAEESPYSWNSLADFSDNIRSILNVYNGEVFGEKTGPGIRDVVARTNPELADRVDARIRQSIQKILDIGGPGGGNFRTGITTPDGRVRVQEAIDDLLSLGQLIDSEVKPALSR